MFTNKPEPPDWWWNDLDLNELVGEVYEEDDEELWMGEVPVISHQKGNDYCICDKCMEEQAEKAGFNDDEIPF